MHDKWTYSLIHKEKSQCVLRIFCPRPGKCLAVRHLRNWQRGSVWVTLSVVLSNSWWRAKADSIEGCQTLHKSHHRLPLLSLLWQFSVALFLCSKHSGRAIHTVYGRPLHLLWMTLSAAKDSLAAPAHGEDICWCHGTGSMGALSRGPARTLQAWIGLKKIVWEVAM